jgi:Flp pilus assembly pilin Flp
MAKSHSKGLTIDHSALIMIFESRIFIGGGAMYELIERIWSDENGQDIAEYAVMLAVILVLVVGTIRLVGSNANNVFSSAASSIN